MYYGANLYLDGNLVTELIIPDSVTSIGSYTFYGCTGLTSVVIGDRVKDIGYEAFCGCTSLESIVIPDSVTSIGEEAFYGCESLTSIVIPDSVTSIGNWAFLRCTGLTSITVDEDNTSYQSIDGNLYSKDGKTLIQYAIGKKNTSFTIPDSVTSFGTVVTRGAKLEKINNKNATEDGRCLIIDNTLNSFAYANLDSYRFPDGITTIGDSACCYSVCSELTIPASVHTIEFGAFVGSQTKILHCEPTTPPTLTFFTLNTQGLMEAIYVPAESVEAYKTAEYWSDFADIIMAE